MTVTEKLARANRWRIRLGAKGYPAELCSSDEDGFNGHFLVPLEGELWHVRLSDGMGWRHLSISNAQRKVLPNWTVMRRAKEAFFDDESWAVQFFPPRSEYINDCEWALHVWECLDEKLPTPSFVLV